MKKKVELESPEKERQAMDVELGLYGDDDGGNDVPVDITKLRIKPGEALPRFYPNLSGTKKTLKAKLTSIANPINPERSTCCPRTTSRTRSSRSGGEPA